MTLGMAGFGGRDSDYFISYLDSTQNYQLILSIKRILFFIFELKIHSHTYLYIQQSTKFSKMNGRCRYSSLGDILSISIFIFNQ